MKDKLRLDRKLKDRVILEDYVKNLIEKRSELAMIRGTNRLGIETGNGEDSKSETECV